MGGSTSYHAGLAAEDIVERAYCDRGFLPLSRRWRGSAGEIDVIIGNATQIVFVEVKKSKSFTRAAAALSERQTRRILQTASEFLATQPDGLLTDARVDVALVDDAGHTRIIENALGH